MSSHDKAGTLFEALLQTASTALGQKIVPGKRGDATPLSFAQQRLWFLDQFEPDNPAYNVIRAFRLTGSVDVAILDRCLNEIMHRHDTLRTIFDVVDEQPVQKINPASTLSIKIYDLSSLPKPKQEVQAQQTITQESRKIFDLTQGPLWQVTLVQLNPEEHILLLVMHHIISDGWSIGVFFQELTTLYKAFSMGKPSPLPKLSIRYTDFTIWQRDWLRGEVSETQLIHWKQQLSDHPPVLNLPTDRPRPAVQSFRGARQVMMIPQELTEALKAVSYQEGVTLFMTLLAAFKVLLYRYSGQTDIIVGSPIANRNRVEIEGSIGFFVNTLALRTDLSSNPSFREVLERVRQVTLAGYAHQDLPFEQLVEALQPERDLSRSPLFQALLVFQNTPAPTLEFSGLELTPIAVDNGTAKFDLTFILVEKTEGLKGTLEYNTDIFDPATIERMMGHFQILLKGIIANPDTPISKLPLLTKAERHQLLVEWNDTAIDYPKDVSLHQLFEAQVKKTPDAVAVIFEDQSLTYSELNVRANQLAGYLKKYNVGPEVLVGICIERSLEMVIGLLGILKAGGVYVPLDPTYPKERLAFILEDTQASILLTQQRLLDLIPLHQVELICLDTDWAIIAHEDESNSVSGVTVENLLYVIYTSGSTGTPKGVALPHRALSNLIAWQLQHTNLSESARTLQFTSLSFDVSCQEIFTTWCSGGTLVLVTEDVRRDVERLAHFIADKAIERLFLPFVALQQMAEVMSTQETLPCSLEEVLTAGEQLQITQSINRFFGRLPDCTLYNQYGPTESHVVTAFKLEGIPNSWSTFPPIGRPIANTQIYILDGQLQPMPIGVPGELYIGGVCLAREYFNRPEQTRERFLLNPFSKEPEEYLYKTSDLARYLPDGNIEFLGRTDHQVKIRGFRIELGEIEVILDQHPAVRESVVTVWEDIPGEKRLVAYVVSQPESSLFSYELQTFLQKTLPAYMIPSAFVILEAIPLTANGKLDRRALPAPDKNTPLLDNFVAPDSPIEQDLANIWTETLGLEKVGIHNNFFGLGGHSLLATRVVSRVRRTFQIELPLRAIFEKPTVAELAKEIELIKESEPKTQPPTITPISRKKYQTQRYSIEKNKDRVG